MNSYPTIFNGVQTDGQIRVVLTTTEPNTGRPAYIDNKHTKASGEVHRYTAQLVEKGGNLRITFLDEASGKDLSLANLYYRGPQNPGPEQFNKLFKWVSATGFYVEFRKDPFHVGGTTEHPMATFQGVEIFTVRPNGTYMLYECTLMLEQGSQQWEVSDWWQVYRMEGYQVADDYLLSQDYEPVGAPSGDDHIRSIVREELAKLYGRTNTVIPGYIYDR